MAKKNKCSLTVYTGEKRLYGMSALLYDINNNYDGYDDFIDKITKQATDKAIVKATEVLVPIIRDELMKELTGPRLKRVK